MVLGVGFGFGLVAVFGFGFELVGSVFLLDLVSDLWGVVFVGFGFGFGLGGFW